MDCVVVKSFLLLSVLLSLSLAYVIYILKKRLREYNTNKNVLIRNAYFNPLTDLPNRLNVELVIGEQIDRCLRHNHSFLIAVVKILNYYDVKAHSEDLADQYIVEASNRILQAVRDEDIVGHITNDGFAIVFNEYLEEENFNIILQRIYNSFAEPPLLDTKYQLEYEISVGVSKFPDNGTSTGLLLDKATKEALK